MNLHHLAVFHTVARTGSVSAASAAMHISQPALSRELRAFEQRLGVTLFERCARGMRLTEPGRLLAGYARRLFALENEAQAAMDAAASARRGHFTIGASNTIGTYVLPGILAEFWRDSPGADIALDVINTRAVAEGVADMRYLIGFVEGPVHVDGLATEAFCSDEIVPVVAGSHSLANAAPQTSDALAGQTLLLREVGSGTRELAEQRIAGGPLATAPTMALANTEALKRAAMHGGGIAWLPRIAIVDELAAGELVAVGPPELTIVRELRIVTRDGVYLPPLAAALLERLQTAA